MCVLTYCYVCPQTVPPSLERTTSTGNTVAYVSAYSYACVHILLHVSASCYICVRILPQMCQHTALTTPSTS